MKSKKEPNASTRTLVRDGAKKLNPFEVHINRSKHKVLGQKNKSDQGLPGISRNKSIQKRKKTLLQEYKMKNKMNQFIDQRIGETNNAMTEEDRILARFAAERKRMFNKKTMFNLSDTEVLTHRGQLLSDIERFEDTRSDDEEDPGETGALRGKFVSSGHFGGGMLTKNKQNRESLIDELINESKQRKAERQRNKEETLEETEQLDEDWKTLGLIISSNKADSSLPNNIGNKDEYDVVMRQLKFEPLGQATQRLKTDEELAKEDREQLEKLEKERLKQLREMQAMTNVNHRSADDMDDDLSYVVDSITVDNFSEGNKDSSDSSSENSDEMDDEDDVSEQEASSGEEEKSDSEEISTMSGEINEDEENEEEEIGQEQSSVVDPEEDFSGHLFDMDDLSDLMPIDENTTASDNVASTVDISPVTKTENENTKNLSIEKNTQTENNIPYIINVPDSFDSFKDLIKDQSADTLNLIFERIVKSNHPNLEPGNKKKMLICAEYIIHLINEEDVRWGIIPVLMQLLSVLMEFNRQECLQMLIDSIATNLEEFESSISSSTSIVKRLASLILLCVKAGGMEGLLSVTKPALGLTCKLLSKANSLSATLITPSLVCCYLLLQDAQSSSKIYTETITYLHNCVKKITSNGIFDDSAMDQKSPQDDSRPACPYAQSNFNESFKSLLTDDEGVKDIQVLHCCVLLLSGFVKAYRKFPQSKFLFKPVHHTFSHIQADPYPAQLKGEITELKTLLQVLQSAQLPALVKSAKRPKALRQYDPVFHTVTLGKSERGLPAEVVEERRLQYKYKQELKGAMRELRRDRVFLANVKLNDKATNDERRAEKVKEIFGSGANQQGELRTLKKKATI